MLTAIYYWELLGFAWELLGLFSRRRGDVIPVANI